VVWLEGPEEDDCLAEDLRYIVPVLTNQSGTRVRYWITVGVKLLKIKAEYARRPRVRITIHGTSGEVVEQEISGESESGRIGEFFEYRFVPTECFIPVEEFAEATGPARRLAREQFRAICDQCEDKEAVIRAIDR